jgi:DNA-binding PadR family transcriptional regulator
MAGESAEQLLQRFRASAAADVMISLLRSQDAEVALALMAAHLGDGQIREAQQLEAAFGADLHDIHRTAVAVPGEAGTGLETDPAAMLKKWTEKGWVHRSREERSDRYYYRLTSGAVDAVNYMAGLDRRSSVATGSAVGMIAEQVGQIAADANPDPVARRESLTGQIKALTEQRDAIDKGEVPQVNHSDLVDRLAALCQWVIRMPSDIVRYGEELEDKTAALMDRGRAEAEEYGQSLQWLFAEYDAITKSPAGQAYQSFHLLIGRREHAAALEAHIDMVLERVEGLPDHLREALTAFVATMRRRSREVEERKITSFRRLRQFVDSGEAHRYRGLRNRLAALQQAAKAAFAHTNGGRDIGFNLRWGTVAPASIGRWQLDNGTPRLPKPLVDTTNEYSADVAAERGTEHIDEAALMAAVDQALAAHGGLANLEQVLAYLDQPRTGEVFTLWSWAGQHGAIDSDLRAHVAVATRRGVRGLTLPALIFDKPIPERTAGARRRRSIEQQATLWEGPDD